MPKFTIMGELTTLNEWNRISRGNKYAANTVKKDTEDMIVLYIQSQMPNTRFDAPVFIKYRWVCKNRRKDKDNVSFAKKFIQDALVKAGVIRDDGWDYITGWQETFDVDAKTPRVEVEIDFDEERLPF